MLKMIIVGTVQGLTEFLPVSSSAHLVFSQRLLGWESPDIFFDVMLHFATLFAVLVFFRKDIMDVLGRPRILMLIAAGNIPAVAVALLFRERIEAMFASPVYPAVFLLVTGAFLFAAARLGRERKDMEGFTVKESVITGIAQGAALLPGISRSGITISAGMLLGWKKVQALRFSFLLSIPVIAGAALMEMRGVDTAGIDAAGIAAGCLAAFASGLGALYMLLEAVRRTGLKFFAYYCWAAGILAILITVL